MEVIVEKAICDLYATLTTLEPKLCGKYIVSMQCEAPKSIHVGMPSINSISRD